MNGAWRGGQFDDMMLFNWLLENIKCGANDDGATACAIVDVGDNDANDHVFPFAE